MEKMYKLIFDPFYDFDKICLEISELLGENIDIVRKKVWRESLLPGTNVLESALKFGIDFHVYNEKMEKFYQETDGFIYESMVYSCRFDKRVVMEKVKQRIDNYISLKKSESKLNILMFGDGVGSDTIYLYNFYKDKVDFYYFDVPGSKTFEFATKRFNKYNIEVKIITDYNKIPKDFFDVIISIEVLEHLPDPIQAIKDISEFLKVGGIVLITESFGLVPFYLPTHLKSNLKFKGKTPFLFLRFNLLLTYFNKDLSLMFRPMEFTKKEKISIKEYLNLILTRPILKAYVKSFIKR
jgi:2-polyprenyl-3-methyl-5-hydroxy-6-metoxy-1,4-benzoquinol methylase